MRAAALLLLALLAAGPARGEERMHVDIYGGSERSLKLAVRFFEPSGAPADAPGLFREELVRALEFSSIFEMVPIQAFLEPAETHGYPAQPPQCDNWRGIGSDGLVEGMLEVRGQEMAVRYRVWDTVRCRPQGEPHRFVGKADTRSLLARRVADEIVARFTGKRGVSATQIAFVSDKGGNKEIYVMEADGSTPRRVTENRSINLFPSWSPQGDTLVYTSYRHGAADLYTISRGKRPGGKLLTMPAEKYLGVFAPGDSKLAVVMSPDGNTDLYTVGLGGRGLRRLTQEQSIETSPSWSPDGRRIAFVSDRSGTPQVWVMDADGGNVRRLTFRGDYNASPAWSPAGHWIAFAARTGSSFDLYLIDPDSGYTTPLVVHPRSDEDPAWSPDGRKLAFSSNRRGRKELYRVDLDGRNLVPVRADLGNCTAPAWSGWLD